MRSSPRSIGLAVLVAFLALVPVTGAFAESTDFESGLSDGSQLEPAGAAPFVPAADNLNTVPEDGSLFRNVKAADAPWVKQILASRPNEDLVICIAGCYSGRDRVIYAQPTTLPPKTADTSGMATTLKKSATAEPRKPSVVNRTN